MIAESKPVDRKNRSGLARQNCVSGLQWPRKELNLADQHWLIAGLGNPGRSYARTWHNAGFQVIDRIAKIHALSFKRERFQSRIAEIRLKNSHCLFIKPQTYMNRSGEAVQSAIQYHEIAIERFLVHL